MDMIRGRGSEIMMTPKPQMVARMHPGMPETVRIHPGMPFPMSSNAIAVQRGQGTEASGAAGTKYPAESKASVTAPPTKTSAAAVQELSTEEKERKRLADIDSIAAVIQDDFLVREAKYGDAQRGIAPYSAQELAFKAAQLKCTNDPEAKMAAGRRVARAVFKADVDAGMKAMNGLTSNQRALVEAGRRMARSVFEADVDAEVQLVNGCTKEQQARIDEGRRIARECAHSDTEHNGATEEA